MISNRITGLKGKKDFVENIVKLMKYFHWSIEDVRKLTIPGYVELIQQVNKIETEKKNDYEKKKKRK